MTPTRARQGVEDVAEGLWRRLRDVMLAERRLETFAFAPEDAERASGAPGRLTALVADPKALADVSRDVTLRAIAAVGDSLNYRILACVGGEAVGLADVSRRVGLSALAVSERVSTLAQLGLATRDLERDAIAWTAAARGLVGLVDAISAELAARCEAQAPTLL